MKKCPECAELIQDDAKKCRYCGREFGFNIPPIGCGGALALFVLAIIVLAQCSPETRNDGVMTTTQIEHIARSERREQKIREAKERERRWQEAD